MHRPIQAHEWIDTKGIRANRLKAEHKKDALVLG